MLVEKKTSEFQIVSLKLVTGEEIIARKLGEEPEGIRISGPLSMVMAENPDNPTQTRVMFTPWMIAASEVSMVIKTIHILSIVGARSDAATQYEAAING